MEPVITEGIMSDKKSLNVEFDIAGGMFVLGVFLLLVLF
jgi:hypothetical protein